MTCWSMTSSLMRPGSMDGAASSQVFPGCSLESWPPSTCSRNARAPEATGSWARHAQVDVIHREIEYDLTVDTARLSPEECARAILAALPADADLKGHS
jgi:hypothetical protein